jgi:hypothetical protein
MLAPTTLDKINALPDNVQEQLFLYVDFLYKTYRENKREENPALFEKKYELSEEGKVFLEGRVVSALTKPGKPWKQVQAELDAKKEWLRAK